MEREKRRPSLEELRELGIEVWRLEAAQIGVDALLIEQYETDREAWKLQISPDITPERVIELREKLWRASECTIESEAHQ